MIFIETIEHASRFNLQHRNVYRLIIISCDKNKFQNKYSVTVYLKFRLSGCQSETNMNTVAIWRHPIYFEHLHAELSTLTGKISTDSISRKMCSHKLFSPIKCPINLLTDGQCNVVCNTGNSNWILTLLQN